MSIAAVWYPRFVGVCFVVIATLMMINPQGNLMADGVDFDSFTIAGKAEVRAYYVGTSLAVAWGCLFSDTRAALQLVAITLGGFAGARVLGYARDGVDSNEAYRFHQNAVFVVEVLGCSLALFLTRAVGAPTPRAKPFVKP